ncbi:hypothetical protein M407DRAFT_8417 [Tulasnella calospora MUT 4182]|uniref:Uncharacterized protein n=1 Tax=Tulasnella calospora MUT 4182 TaxID=1051891 RepID=A0A0C3QHY2_9AGAM|nr:hypothetical protein M407DRAFT_8417 [Tulasnella calospora MUT 4182]
MYILNKPLPVQLATTGSRTKVNCSVDVEFSYQSVKEKRRFNVINFDEYDIILGTPFLYQYKVAIGFNPTQIALGVMKAAPIQGIQHLESLRQQLKNEAKDLCKDITDTPLPPMRAVNHTIPLIDENKVEQVLSLQECCWVALAAFLCT